MANQLRKKESVRKSIRRLGRARIDRALEDLEKCRTAEAVHAVRKHIKKLRALLRLVRSSMSSGDYSRFSKKLKKAAGYLSEARDAQVKVTALEHLSEHFKPELSARSFAAIKKLLDEESKQEQTGLSRVRASKRVCRLLKQLRGHFGSLELQKSGWQAMASGVKRSYRDGRDGYKLACKRPAPENFHEWRKRVKDLYYQLRLLRPIWPEQMRAAEEQLKQLGETLGDDHDLFLLNAPEVKQRFQEKAPKEAEALEALILKRQRDLRAAALKLGGRLYQEKPADYCARLGQYWKRWRSESK